ncbi:MAG: DsbA family protein [Anaerolineales bacterium]
MIRSAREQIRFLFDPACPWAYRASLWLREVAELLPLEIEWEIFSLEAINRTQKDEAYLQPLRAQQTALRLLELTIKREGQSAVDALYLELGKARHERSESLADEAVLLRALSVCGLPIALLAEARENADLDAAIATHAADAVAQGAFGVPTLHLAGAERWFYGPLLARVPEGYRAVRVWEHVRGLMLTPEFYELKSSR